MSESGKLIEHFFEKILYKIQHNLQNKLKTFAEIIKFIFLAEVPIFHIKVCNIHGRSVRKMITYPPTIHKY